MQFALRVCWSALPRRAFHPVVSCRWRRGFYRPHGRGLNGTDSVCDFLGLQRAALKAAMENEKWENWLRADRMIRGFTEGKWLLAASRIENCAMAENEEPCWLCERAGFSKIDDLGLDRELPARLLVEVIITVFARNTRKARMLFGYLDVGGWDTPSGVQAHTCAPRPCRRLRLFEVCGG